MVPWCFFSLSAQTKLKAEGHWIEVLLCVAMTISCPNWGKKEVKAFLSVRIWGVPLYVLSSGSFPNYTPHPSTEPWQTDSYLDEQGLIKQMQAY